MASTDTPEQREERKVKALESIAQSLGRLANTSDLTQRAVQMIANKK